MNTVRRILLPALAGLCAMRVRAETVAGSGGVAYFGDPSLEKSIAGSGSVRRLGAAPG